MESVAGSPTGTADGDGDEGKTPEGGTKGGVAGAGLGGRPPFKLCFRLARVKGRSDTSPCHPRGYVHGVTGKFYSVREARLEGEPDVEAVRRAYTTEPRHRYDAPLLDSHNYGWHHGVTFSDLEILNDRRLNFYKRTDILFKTPTSFKK